MHLLVVLFTFALATTSFAQPAPTATIMETLLRARQDRVSSIVQAIQAAGLADTLQKGKLEIELNYSIIDYICLTSSNLIADGPFILFAPSNDAFKALPEGTLGKLLAAPADLKKILLNHVVKVNVPSNELKSGDLTSLGGSVLKVVVSPTGKKILNMLILFKN